MNVRVGERLAKEGDFKLKGTVGSERLTKLNSGSKKPI